MVLSKYAAPLLGLLMATNVHAADKNPKLTVEIGGGLNNTRNSELVLLGLMYDNAPLFGIDSYTQVNLGGWRGRTEAATVGVAKGLRWQWGDTRVHASLGGSLVSDTDDAQLSTAFQFYEQLAVQRQFGDIGAALSYRHWSNGGIKKPNGGMNFLGVEFAYRW